MNLYRSIKLFLARSVSSLTERSIKPQERSDLSREEQRLEIWRLRGIPSYDENNLVTWAQSVDFMSDSRFLAAYGRGMDSGHQIMRPPGSRDDIQIKWRVAICCWAGRHASRLAGDFVECGTNTGILSLAICEYIDFNSTGKYFWLFDTFEGIPLEQISEEEHKQSRAHESETMYPPCYELAQRNFAPFPRARLVKGKVPDTLASVAIEKVCYLSLDMNIAAPERAAMEYFWPRLVTGGIIVLDDYGWTPYRAQKRILDDFAVQRGVEIMMLPTGQGLLIKS